MTDADPLADEFDRRTVLGLAAGASTALAGCVDLGANPALEVPDSARIDEPVGVVATGLPPETDVRVDAATTHPNGIEEWTTSVTVRTDADGRVDLRDATPVDGAYEERDGMGLFWSMRPDDAIPMDVYFPLEAHDVSLAVRRAATTDGGSNDATSSDRSRTTDDALATATTTRALPEPTTESLGDDLIGDVYYPSRDDPAPAVVFLHGSEANVPEGDARLLAEHGYVTATLRYFGVSPLPSTLTEIPVEYVEKAIRRLQADDQVADGPVGLHGISKGGELALLAGAHLDDVGAVVSVSGSGVVWEGLREGNYASGSSSWTLDGEPVPYVPFLSAKSSEDNLDDADAQTRADATISVERIDGPVALFSGRKDDLWNTARLQGIAADRRRDAGEPVTHEVYDDAGHDIGPPFVPTFGRSNGALSLGGTPAGNAHAARSCWQLTLETFEQGLRN